MPSPLPVINQFNGMRVTRPSGGWVLSCILPAVQFQACRSRFALRVTPCSETPYRTKKSLIIAALSDMAIDSIFDPYCLLSGFDDDARSAVRLADATTANRNLRARLIGSSW
jgi:hypothetical protein